MGQAKRRGSFEERKAQAIQKEQDRLGAIEAKRQLKYEQEIQAYKTMVWWQIDLSEIRYERIMKAKHKSQMGWASLMGMCYGMGWNSLSSLGR
jgi:hypothetical protein